VLPQGHGACAVVLIDFMLLREGRASSHIVRLVIGRRGTVPMRAELIAWLGCGIDSAAQAGPRTRATSSWLEALLIIFAFHRWRVRVLELQPVP
jgi:hypothetical protein